VIYFVERPGDGHIKIGTTIRLSERLKQLMAEYGDGLVVLAIVEGDHRGEYGLHRRFAHLRTVGEWFEPGDDLLGYIVAEGQEWDGSDDDPGYLSAKLPVDVIESARIVAAYRGETITEMLGDILRPILADMEKEEVAKRSKAPKGKGGPK
jgi:hypothetical protein